MKIKNMLKHFKIIYMYDHENFHNFHSFESENIYAHTHAHTHIYN